MTLLSRVFIVMVLSRVLKNISLKMQVKKILIQEVFLLMAGLVILGIKNLKTIFV